MLALDKNKLDKIKNIIVDFAKFDNVSWPWLSEVNGKPVDKKRANKYIFGCIIDYQTKADIVWDKVKKFTEEYLGDPEELWKEFFKRYPTIESWTAKKKEYNLHHLLQAHERIWTIGQIILKDYDGDIRKSWLNKEPAQILECFNNKLKLGEQISRMTLGGLIASKQVIGTGDVKADTHVRRVLARIFYNHYNKERLSEKEATELARKIYPENPWALDGPLYITGKNDCKAKEPDCDQCDIASLCDYFISCGDETSHVFLTNKGLTLYEDGKYEEAIENYKKAITIEYDYIFALTGIGDCLMAMKEYEKSVEFYEKSINLYILFQAGVRSLPYKNAFSKPCISDYTDVLKKKGNCLFNLKRYKEARKCYEKAMKLDSTRKDIKEAIEKCNG